MKKTTTNDTTKEGDLKMSEITTNYSVVYNVFKNILGDRIAEEYIASGEKWKRFNFTGCKKAGVAIFFNETRDNKINVRFAKEFVNFLPSFLNIKDHHKHRGYSIKLNASTDSESFFSMLREAVDKFASQQGTAEETAEEI